MQSVTLLLHRIKGEGEFFSQCPGVGFELMSLIYVSVSVFGYSHQLLLKRYPQSQFLNNNSFDIET